MEKFICWSPQPLWGIPQQLPEQWQWIFGPLSPDLYPLVTGLILNGSDGYYDGQRLALWPSLRVISSYGIGYDHINVEEARSRGVIVTHTPDAVTQSTAELALALTLGLIRRLIPYDRETRSAGRVLTGSNTGLSHELFGKTVGILGYGRIGQTIARLLAPFGVSIQYTRQHGPHPSNPDQFVSFDHLLTTSDIIIAIVPLTTDTHHLIGQHEFEKMKPGGFIVNVGRGPLIDENALVLALESGQLAGAALDVYENEPIIHPGLLQRDDVILSPHRGTSTFETRERMTTMAIDNLVHALTGTPVREVPPN